MEQIDPDAVSLPGWYRPNRASPATWRSWRSAPSAGTGAQADHQLPLGVVGLRHGLGRGAGPQRHGVLPDPAAPPVRAAGEPGRGGGRRRPHRPVPRAAAGAVRRRDPPVRGHGGLLHLGHAAGRHRRPRIQPAGQPSGSAVHRIGHADRTVAAHRRGVRPAKIVEFFATTDGQAVLANVAGVKVGSRAGRCPAAARWNWPPMTPMTTSSSRDDRGFVQVAQPNQVGVLLARPWGRSTRRPRSNGASSPRATRGSPPNTSSDAMRTAISGCSATGRP